MTLFCMCQFSRDMLGSDIWCQEVFLFSAILMLMLCFPGHDSLDSWQHWRHFAEVFLDAMTYVRTEEIRTKALTCLTLRIVYAYTPTTKDPINRPTIEFLRAKGRTASLGVFAGL